jgi:Arylsulfotransferase (ASST)
MKRRGVSGWLRVASLLGTAAFALVIAVPAPARTTHPRAAPGSRRQAHGGSQLAPRLDAGETAPGFRRRPRPIRLAPHFPGVTRRAAVQGLTITATPALAPSFDPSVHDYVTRCEPGGSVSVSVTSVATPVSIDGHPAQVGTFTMSVAIGAGQRFTITLGSGLGTYNVRCLPADFPGYTIQQFSAPQAAYYLVTPSTALGPAPAAPYVAMFDRNGVPVWWYRQAVGVPLNADLVPGGTDLSWDVETGTPSPFGLPGAVQLEVHALDGTLIRTLQTSGIPADFHEAWPLDNGDFLMSSYVLRTRVDLLFGPTDVLDGAFQEVRPDGSVAFSWTAAGHVAPYESLSWFATSPYPGDSNLVWDWDHINAVQPYQDGYLVSMRHTDAIYYVRRSDGAIVWKLGGWPTPQSLTMVGEPNAWADFGGQHDVRAWPDGTISVHDNGTNWFRGPRVLRFRIDMAAHTATLIQTITDPLVPTSICCGSARLLPGGDWVVDWGGTQLVEELTPTGQPVLRIALASPYFTYRAVPVVPGRLSATALVAAMDKMHPRTPGA